MPHPFSVCVYCGSRDGAVPAYLRDAEVIGEGLAAQRMRLVYGAGDIGVMGRVASAAMGAGGEVFGVIPQHLVDWEVGKTDIQTYVVTETMHERKKVMFTNSDAVLTLPGGPGTLDELFEVMTWRQLGLHSKPILLLNTAGYWDGLLALLNTIIAQGFAKPSFPDMLEVFDTPEAVLERLAELRGARG
ncbi:MAG: TIGR00730 family Rossman fold protein [Pseudomonadota bacterium]